MKITKKIVGYTVNKPTDATETAAVAVAAAPVSKTADVIQMHETLQRPNKLIGSTYKLKTPEHVSSHAMYITVNDIILNEGTEHELRRPFEVFINSKNLEHYQWIVALTLIMSAVFRKGGDITFLVDELRSVFDPRGGYWNKGKYSPSIVAEIGDVIERHLIDIGMLKSNEMDEHQKQLIADKKAELEAKANPADDTATAGSTDGTTDIPTDESSGQESWAANATMCAKCNNKSVVLLDGCQTCMTCGDSKCG